MVSVDMHDRLAVNDIVASPFPSAGVTVPDEISGGRFA
jgi:hypothetical protein